MQRRRSSSCRAKNRRYADAFVFREASVINACLDVLRGERGSLLCVGIFGSWPQRIPQYLNAGIKL